MREQARLESVLDRAIPLCAFGPPLMGRPESGPTVQEYYRAKLCAGESDGRFDPLFLLAVDSTFAPDTPEAR